MHIHNCFNETSLQKVERRKICNEIMFTKRFFRDNEN